MGHPSHVPKVSVGLPVYNGERYLAEGIESTLAQTFTDFELIISDNGSTDRTPQICAEYAAKDARVRVLRVEDNQGAAWNYNRVFDTARGQYFRWAPADDKFHPDSIAECVAVLDAHPDVVLCYPQTMLIDEDGNEIGRYEDDLDLRDPDVSVRFSQAIRRNRLVSAMYGLMRTDAMRGTAVFAGFPGSDVTFLAELVLHGRFWEIPRPLFYRRIHGAASTSLKTMEGVQEWFDPKKKGTLFLYLWTHLGAHLAAVKRAPQPAVKKIVLLAVLARWVIGSRNQFGKELIDAAMRRLTNQSTTPITQGDIAVGTAKGHTHSGAK
ncbi:MAG: glycosyltransferase [Nitrospira sp.]